jgi:hypothetical protein
MDGHFMGVARQGGVRNFQHQVDQRLFYSCKEKMHCFKWLTVVLGNRMLGIKGPCPGSFHDATMFDLLGWRVKLMAYYQQYGVQLQFFADACFANEDQIITMIKSYVTLAGLTFNTLMARISIFKLIENVFAGQHLIFNWLSLSFKHKLCPGGSNINWMHIVASFMMNIYTTYYGSQFTAAMEEAGVDLQVHTADLLKRAHDTSAAL